MLTSQKRGPVPDRFKIALPIPNFPPNHRLHGLEPFKQHIGRRWLHILGMRHQQLAKYEI